MVVSPNVQTRSKDMQTYAGIDVTVYDLDTFVMRFIGISDELSEPGCSLENQYIY